MTSERNSLTDAQTQRVEQLTRNGVRCNIERDEPHDLHVFVSLYTDGCFTAEHIVDADGSCCDGTCS